MAKKFARPLHNENDTTQMRDAIDVFDRERLAVARRRRKPADTSVPEAGSAIRKSPHHLKCGPLNYWPSTGKIHFDDRPKITENGLDALGTIIHKHRNRLPRLRDEIAARIDELIIPLA
jgi:hypothetical protein